MKSQYIKYFFLAIGTIGLINIVENQLYARISICPANIGKVPVHACKTAFPNQHSTTCTKTANHIQYLGFPCGKPNAQCTYPPCPPILKHTYSWKKGHKKSASSFLGVVNENTFITTIQQEPTGIKLTVNNLSTSQLVSTIISSQVPVANLQLYQTTDDIHETKVKFALVNRAISDKPTTVATVKFDSEAFTLTTVKEPVPFSSFAFHLARLFNTCVAVDQELV